MSWSELLAWVQQNINVFKSAPLTCFLLLLFGCGGGFWVSRWHYCERISVLEARLELKNDQLWRKDEQLAFYREKAEGIESAEYQYHDLAKDDLSQRSLMLVKKIRSLLADYRVKHDEVLFSSRYRPTAGAPEPERSRLWQEMTSASQQLFVKTMNRYKVDYLSNALVLAEETQSRGIGKAVDRARYLNPTNPLGIEEIANDLEERARKLEQRK